MPAEQVILIIVLVFVILTTGYSVFTGISPVPSSPTSYAKIEEILLDEGVTRVVDLGAGWGCLLMPLAAAMPEVQFLGYELSPFPLVFARLRGALFRRRNVRIERQDLRKTSFQGADAVICYLYSELLEKLRPNLERDLKPGTIVVSNVFDIPGWRPEAVHRLDCSQCPQVYVYRVPDRTAAAAAAGVGMGGLTA
ncbi:MAG: hypothetical protein COW30_07675 [Rhodospirillales bacterium CG15_BIG_FIL_POST_REV_8_21_14_020_66_15]|nr:MAG: hypothetical protein COW30_07675 [Rhodospirillales bacterium CG15_BIG_FIL_POST_REV_8_21_14_020_66_15]